LNAHDPSWRAGTARHRPSAHRLLPDPSRARVPARHPHPQQVLSPAAAHGGLVRVPRLGPDRGPLLRERQDPPRPPRELEEGQEVQVRAEVDPDRVPRARALRAVGRRRAEGRHLRLPIRARRVRERASPAGDLRAGDHAVTSSPPSTPITFPLIQPAPGSVSATIAPATSSGTVRRPPGFRRRASSKRTSATGILREAGVSVTPARMALTAMRAPPSSNASWRTCDSSAALAADRAP